MIRGVFIFGVLCAPIVSIAEDTSVAEGASRQFEVDWSACLPVGSQDWANANWETFEPLLDSSSLTLRSVAIDWISQDPLNADRAAERVFKHLGVERVAFLRKQSVEQLVLCGQYGSPSTRRVVSDFMFALMQDEAEPEPVRAVAVAYAFATKEPRLLPILYGFLETGSPTQQRFALDRLPTLDDQQCCAKVTAYFERAIKGGDREQVLSALRCLATLKDKTANVALLTILTGGTSRSVYEAEIAAVMDLIEPGSGTAAVANIVELARVAAERARQAEADQRLAAQQAKERAERLAAARLQYEQDEIAAALSANRSWVSSQPKNQFTAFCTAFARHIESHTGGSFRNQRPSLMPTTDLINPWDAKLALGVILIKDEIAGNNSVPMFFRFVLTDGGGWEIGEYRRGDETSGMPLNTEDFMQVAARKANVDAGRLAPGYRAPPRPE